MEKIARKINGMGESKANKLIGFLCMIAVACWLALFANLTVGMSPFAEAAKPPASTTYWLVSGYPDAPVYTEMDVDPFVAFDRNWIVFTQPDGTQSVYHQNCKVVRYDIRADGKAYIDRVEYYGDDFLPTSFDGTPAFGFGFMGTEVAE